MRTLGERAFLQEAGHGQPEAFWKERKPPSFLSSDLPPAALVRSKTKWNLESEGRSLPGRRAGWNTLESGPEEAREARQHNWLNWKVMET